MKLAVVLERSSMTSSSGSSILKLCSSRLKTILMVWCCFVVYRDRLYLGVEPHSSSGGVSPSTPVFARSGKRVQWDFDYSLRRLYSTRFASFCGKISLLFCSFAFLLFVLLLTIVKSSSSSFSIMLGSSSASLFFGLLCMFS